MEKVIVNLGDMNTVKKFVQKTSKLDCDMDLVSGRYVVDGKSIMGIFSLDLSKPVELDIDAEGPILAQAIDELSEFIVKE